MGTRATLIALLLTCACFAGRSVASAPDDPDRAALLEKADAAYEAQAYLECAESYALAAAESAASGDYYNAGCCYALAGAVDEAFEVLERAIDAGFRRHDLISNDTDLASLHDDPRWERLLAPIAIVITENVSDSAAEAEFVFEDTRNFLRALELIEAGEDPVATLEREYLARATAGLKQFLVKYPFTAQDLVAAMERYPQKYARIARNVEMLEARIPDLRAAYERYEELTPDVVFPPTYFLVGRHRGIASGSPDGQLITIERRTDESIRRIETLLVHELTHFQQLTATGSDEFYALFGPKKTLLGLTIREGAAEFIADRVTKRITQEDARDHLLEHEAEIWSRFQKQMHGSDTKGWMWSEPDDPDQPRDLAYALGARIIEAYYDKAPDKREALQEIFGVVDYVSLLTKSGYGSPGN